MRWRIKQVPFEGQQRVVRRFAWFPVAAFDHLSEPWIVWLRGYWEQQKWENGDCHYGGCSQSGWRRQRVYI